MKEISDSSNFISSSFVDRQSFDSLVLLQQVINVCEVNNDCMYTQTHRADLRSAAAFCIRLKADRQAESERDETHRRDADSRLVEN